MTEFEIVLYLFYNKTITTYQKYINDKEEKYKNRFTIINSLGTIQGRKLGYQCWGETLRSK